MSPIHPRRFARLFSLEFHRLFTSSPSLLFSMPLSRLSPLFMGPHEQQLLTLQPGTREGFEHGGHEHVSMFQTQPSSEPQPIATADLLGSNPLGVTPILTVSPATPRGRGSEPCSSNKEKRYICGICGKAFNRAGRMALCQHGVKGPRNVGCGGKYGVAGW